MTFLAWRADSGRDSLSNYFGNPNVTVTNIDTSGGIACSRTSGKTPCFIHVSASAITATGTDWPYEDLYYEWNFGDTSSTETFTNPGVGGGTVNSNSDQTGPSAAHCYRSAGTYTITLTIRGKSGASTAIRRTVTQAITVTAWSASGGEYWADSNAGGTNAGTEANPFNTLSAINTAIAGGDLKQVHVKRGSVFQGSTYLAPYSNGIGSYTGFRMDAYGSGDLPRFDISSGSNPALFVYGGGSGSPSPKDDMVFSNIHFSISGGATSAVVAYIAAVGNDNAIVKNIYFDNCRGEAFAINADNYIFMYNASGEKTQLYNTGLWNCTLEGPQLAPSSHHSMGMFVALDKWFFKIGGGIIGGTGFGRTSLEDPNFGLDHHIYPSIKKHSLYRWIDFGYGVLRSFCINCSVANTTPEVLIYSNYIHVAECNLTGVEYAVDLSNSNSNLSESHFRNTVIEKNRIHDLWGDGAIQSYMGIRQTVRYNEVYNLGAKWIAIAYNIPSTQTMIYHNKVYIPTTALYQVIAFDNAGFTAPQTITDNIFQDMRTSALITTIPFTQQAGSPIDRNQYYAPNDSDAKFLRDIATDKSFAEWQAAGFDTNGSVADPGWTDPANGDFS